MFRKLTLGLLAGLFLGAPMVFAEVYELRTYTTHEGKLDDLNARFRNHTVELFKKHGIESVGYWVPTDEKRANNTLIYVIKHKSRDAARASWQAFIADPQWKAAKAASEADGPILSESPESVYMNLTDYSPKFANDKQGNGGVYELRIYRTNEGKLENLDARFRDNTIRIFNRYGIQSVAYWHPTDEPDSKDTLIYILRHDSREAASKSWKAFIADEEWKKVAAESQKDGRILRRGGIEATYMKPTDYSALQ